MRNILVVLGQYFTSNFRSDSVVHWSQQRSRLDRLVPLLNQLVASAHKWPSGEFTQFQRAILSAASQLCEASPEGSISEMDSQT